MSRKVIHSSESTVTLNPLDLHKEFKSRNLERTKAGIAVAHTLNREVTQGQVLDITKWIGQAAPHYNISSSLDDFVMVPVVTVPAELPNRNGVGFPLSTLLEFIPEAGQLSYQTFKGKPTFYEHQNKDITQAKGIIADSFLRKMVGYGGAKGYKLVKLLMFDRTKDEVLANRILSRDPAKRINTYSMGAFLKSQVCSYCLQEVGRCPHIDPDPKRVTFYEKDGHVVHKVMRGVVGFETSAVESPAWSIAISDDLVASPVDR